MSILNKLKTLVKAVNHDACQGIIEQNALLIARQELADCEQQLLKAKNNLAKIKADRLLHQRTCDQLQEKINEKEEQAQQALQKNLTGLVDEIVCFIAEKEDELQAEQQAIVRLKQYEGQLQNSIKQSSKRLTDFKLDLKLAHSTERFQKSQSTLTGNGNQLNQKLAELSDSMSNIKHNQELNAEMIAVQAQIVCDEDPLDQKLQEAGIVKKNQHVYRLIKVST